MKHVRHEFWSSAEVSRLVALLNGERQYLESILDALPVPVVVLSDDLIVRAGNEAFWRAAGWTRNNGLQRAISEIAGENDAAFAIRDALDAACPSVRLAGRDFLISRLPVSDEIVLASETPTQAASTQVPDARVRELLDGLPDGVLIVGSEGRIEEANAAAEKLLGLTAPQLRGTLVSSLLEPAPDGWPPNPGAPPLRIRLRTAQNEVDAEASAAPAGVGRLAYVLRDITPQLATEQRLRFEERMTAVSRVAGGVSHQLNNILTVITSYSHLALEQIGTIGNGAGEEDVQVVLKAAGDATQLGNQLVSLGRRHVQQEAATDLNALLQGADRTLRGICGENVRLTVLLEPELPSIKADPRQLEQAIVAVVLHARDAMGDSGSITIRTARRTETAGQPEQVVVSITDTRNWPPEFIGMQLFEPYAAYPGTKRNSGLDMAVAWSFVRNNHGQAVVEPDTPGVTVRFAFPVIQSAVPKQEPAAPAVAAPVVKSAGSVLLVDDNSEIRSAVRIMLERQAYAVTEASDPDHALSLVEQTSHPIDVLVSDVNMPEMSGRELAAKARRLRPGLKVLMMSGYADEEIEMSELDEHVMFLQKPFSPDRLARTLRALIAVKAE
jgi:signal transduction histidine kinase